MLAVVKSIGMIGLEGSVINVEVDICNGLPGLEIVGLPDKSVRESKERVRSAIKNSGFGFPNGRITVNLAPADFRKAGSLYDVAISIGLLAASGQLHNDRYRQFVCLGELSLAGSLRGVAGILPSVMCARDNGIKEVIVPMDNADEAAIIQGMMVYPVESLRQLTDFLNGNRNIPKHTAKVKKSNTLINLSNAEDMAEVKGQPRVKRAMEVAAAGGHNLIMIGPPGSGKTMLARRFPGIVTDMSFEEALEVTKIYSIAGMLKNGTALVTQRPFRAPHHNVSKSGMVGGGSIPRPGEASLAHHGILFMDEFPEFRKDTLESLRQPIEDGRICISRTNGTIEFPAKMMLIAAMNPCPCGYLGDDAKECTCTSPQISRYRSKVSGPLLDRMDIQVEVPRSKYSDLCEKEQSESSEQIRKRVARARQVQRKRFIGTGTQANAQMNGKDIKLYCKLEGRAESLIREAFNRLSLSSRAYYRILKVARTIADLSSSALISETHIAEAIQYRNLDRSF